MYGFFGIHQDLRINLTSVPHPEIGRFHCLTAITDRVTFLVEEYVRIM